MYSTKSAYIVYESSQKLHWTQLNAWNAIPSLAEVPRLSLSLSLPSLIKMHWAIIVLPIEPNRTFYCSNHYFPDWERALHLFSREFVYLFAARLLQSRRVLSVGSEYQQRTYWVSTMIWNFTLRKFEWFFI